VWLHWDIDISIMWSHQILSWALKGIVYIKTKASVCWLHQAQPCLGPRQNFKNLVGSFFDINMRSLYAKFQPPSFKLREEYEVMDGNPLTHTDDTLKNLYSTDFSNHSLASLARGDKNLNRRKWIPMIQKYQRNKTFLIAHA